MRTHLDYLTQASGRTRSRVVPGDTTLGERGVRSGLMQVWEFRSETSLFFYPLSLTLLGGVKPVLGVRKKGFVSSEKKKHI